MITSDVEQRVIALADAAGRATGIGLHGLAEKLTTQAEALLCGRSEVPEGFDQHTVMRDGVFRCENGTSFRGPLYEGTVVYIKRSR